MSSIVRVDIYYSDSLDDSPPVGEIHDVCKQIIVKYGFEKLRWLSKIRLPKVQICIRDVQIEISADEEDLIHVAYTYTVYKNGFPDSLAVFYTSKTI